MRSVWDALLFAHNWRSFSRKFKVSRKHCRLFLTLSLCLSFIFSAEMSTSGLLSGHINNETQCHHCSASQCLELTQLTQNKTVFQLLVPAHTTPAIPTANLSHDASERLNPYTALTTTHTLSFPMSLLFELISSPYIMNMQGIKHNWAFCHRNNHQ